MQKLDILHKQRLGVAKAGRMIANYLQQDNTVVALLKSAELSHT